MADDFDCDDNDNDFLDFVFHIGLGGWAAIILVVVALVFMCVGMSKDSRDCKASECLTGYPRSVNGECLCIGEPVR